jgi:NedA-like, galactose-binding domain
MSHGMGFGPARLCSAAMFAWVSVAVPTSAVGADAPKPAAKAHSVRVEAAPDREVHSFVPERAFGAGIDRLNASFSEKAFETSLVERVLEAGWQTVSYRQNTELHVEAWHWNPRGRWSDPAGQGYFTGDAEPGEPIRHSFGYFLPHRGVTRNDGTDSSGYSRVTDGDPASYWKSNPYLSHHFTGEDDALHPQWLVVDLAGTHAVNGIRIDWAEPFARRYLVQYWSAEDQAKDPIRSPTQGVWRTFPGGDVRDAKGGSATLALAPAPIPVRHLRIWMTESSDTCDTHGDQDRRNCVGYAVRELSLGTLGADGQLFDLVRHTPDQDQTTVVCSSVDPWHTPADVNDARDQVGLDLFFTSPITRGLPTMVPVSMLYATPEDAAAQIAYLKKRGYPISYVEMGEEPDGQFMLPEDYGALYVQWADALHAVDRTLKLGGPVFEGVNEDIQVWPDALGRTSWLRRFLDYLKARGRLADFTFFSFEHYPYEPCHIQWSSLYDEPKLISHIVQVWREALPKGTPLFITESNIAWQSAANAVDVFGALWLADFMGAFLTAGGDANYYFHYIPTGLHAGCNGSRGTFGMFTLDAEQKIQQPTSQFFASQVLTKEWVVPGAGAHRVFPAASDVTDPAGNILVTAYALLRPDADWSVLLVNKDQTHPHPVTIAFRGIAAGRDGSFAGPVRQTTFGSAQYRWHPDVRGGWADPDGPPVSTSITAVPGTVFTLPEASITVLRGRLGSTSGARSAERRR